MNSHFKDPAFLARLKKLEKEAVSEVVSAYTSHLISAGLGQGLSEEKARDVCHNTWLTFFDVLERFEGRSHIRTFLFGIFYHKVSEYRRQNLKYESYDPIDEVLESRFADDGHWNQAVRDPATYLENEQMMKIVEGCMEKLPDVQKAVLTMKLIEEFSTEEICEVLKLSASNFRQLLFRGRSRVKECVESHLD